VRTKNSEKATAPTIAIAAFEAESVRERKIRNGRSGDRERNSIATKAAMSAAAPLSRPIVTGELQPSVVARVRA